MFKKLLVVHRELPQTLLITLLSILAPFSSLIWFYRPHTRLTSPLFSASQQDVLACYMLHVTHTGHTLRQPHTGQWCFLFPVFGDVQKRAFWLNWGDQEQQVTVTNMFIIICIISLYLSLISCLYLSSVFCLSEMGPPQTQQVVKIQIQLSCRRGSETCSKCTTTAHQ